MCEVVVHQVVAVEQVGEESSCRVGDFVLVLASLCYDFGASAVQYTGLVPERWHLVCRDWHPSKRKLKNAMASQS